MRVPVEWLREYCSPELDTEALSERLTMTGTKVEAIHNHGVGDPAGLVVGKVTAVDGHPDADRLSVCEVDLGDGAAARIVCGAPNVAAGLTVAVARPGAVLAGGVELEARPLRGVVSEGMILAEDELGIGSDHSGIIELDSAAQPGTPLSEVIPLATDVLELEITPNRPDCLAVYGVARELHAATGAPLSQPPWAEDPASSDPLDAIEVSIAAPELCRRFTARLFEDVEIGPSPAWLRSRLVAAGQRPISNVVDITNYAMLLTGQPMHAFDADRIEGGRLEVRRAREDEELETLDGSRQRLTADMVAIADGAGLTSLGGIMGGARSEVSDETRRVLMEAATWDGPNIQRTSSALSVRSEASARFEKQLQPEQTLDAQAIAAKLMVELCGARIVPGTIDVGPNAGGAPPPAPIRLRDARLQRLLGVAIPRSRSREILEALEFEISDAEDGLDARPPAFRRDDVTREADLIEEVARIDGLEQLPSTLPARRDAQGGLSSAQALRRRVEDALADRGIFETLGWSFSPAQHDDRLQLSSDDERRTRHVEVLNPMAADQRLLRTQLVGSLLDAAAANTARGRRELRLFEVGTVYRKRGERLPQEQLALAVLLGGPVRPPTWREPRPPAADFFAAKGLLGALLGSLHLQASVEPVAEPFLHPGRSAAIHIGEAQIGWLGELHPRVAEAWGIEAAIAGFELELDRVIELALALGEPMFEDLASVPAVHEDLAVVVDEQVPAARVVEVVRNAGGPTLARAEIFDVYRGEQAGEGRVSLALALEFRTPERTLTDAEVAERRRAIIDALAAELGASARV